MNLALTSLYGFEASENVPFSIDFEMSMPVAFKKSA